MKLMFFAPGSRGDVQPYLALGHRLRQRGHAVRIVTSVDFADLIAAYDLEPHLVALDVRRALQERAAAIEGGGVLASFRAMAELGRQASRELATRGLEAAQGCDAVITGFGGLSLASGIAERAGVPLIRAFNVPLMPTSRFAGALFPGWPRWLWRASHVLTRQVLWQASRFASAAARREILGVGSDAWSPPFESGDSPALYGLSTAVLPRPTDWDDRVVMTGFWFADEPPGFEPPAALTAFLAAGPPPIYVGFGSMSTESPEATTRLVLDAIVRSGQRAVLHAGWAGLGDQALPPDVLLVDSVPHGWLFPRCSAVVHHGGAGTTAAGFNAGVPTVVVPFHGDQPFWGAMVAAQGLGPAPVPRGRLTAQRLAAAISAALDPAIVARASALGAALNAEDGTGTGAAWIEAIASGDTRPAGERR